MKDINTGLHELLVVIGFPGGLLLRTLNTMSCRCDMEADLLLLSSNGVDDASDGGGNGTGGVTGWAACPGGCPANDFLHSDARKKNEYNG